MRNTIFFIFFMCVIPIGYSQISKLEESDSLEISDGLDNDCDSDTSTIKRMNKGELIDAIAKDVGLSKADAGKALNAITTNLLTSFKLQAGPIFILSPPDPGVSGTERTGRNPQTGATIKIAVKKVAKFKAGKALADELVNRIDNSQNPQGDDGEIQMNKGELIDAIAKDANLTKTDAGNALNAFIAILSEELNNGNCVKLIVPVAINKGIREGGKTVDPGVDEILKRKAPGRIKYSNITLERGYIDDDSDDDGLSDSLEISDGIDNNCDSDTSSTKRMNKGELVDAIAKDAGLSKADAGKALNAITTNLLTSLKKDESIQLIDSPNVSDNDKTIKNPQTEATMKYDGKKLADTVKRTDNSQNPQGNNDNIQMNKGELVDAIAKDANLSKTDAGKALNAFMANMSKEINNGNCVKLIVPVAINKGIGEDGKTVLPNNKNQQGYTKESAMIFVKVDETSLRNSNTKIPNNKLVQDNDKRMSKSTSQDKARTLRTADKRYSDIRDERVKARALRTADKRYSEKISGHRVRDKENTIQIDKPVQITTEENNKVNPSNNLSTRFLKAQNNETIQISKSKFQLTAPLLISNNQNELIVYNWAVKNKIKNKVAKFTGKTINYDFDVSGTYEIEIIPVINNKNLNPFHVNIICD